MDAAQAAGRSGSSSQRSPSEIQASVDENIIIDERSNELTRKPTSHTWAVSGKLGRHTLGIILLSVTVLLWTTSNFLASTIFADDSYSKPYFVTYLNTTSFCLFLLVVPLQQLSFFGGSRTRNRNRKVYTSAEPPNEPGESTSFLEEDNHVSRPVQTPWRRCITWSRSIWTLFDHTDVSPSGSGRLSVRATAGLSLEFCLLWFAANYSVAAGLEYTTVGSSTILTSTSSVWTLVFGVLFRVEAFSLQKLAGVLISLFGVAMISKLDLSGETDNNRGDFPHKSTVELAIGDFLSLASAVLYGTYSVLMKKRIRDESRVNMLLFFAFVGAINTLLLWPGLIILHATGVEVFELPPTSRIWIIVILNSVTSLISDLCWAYAMLLTSPLVVTIGLSLSIPLALTGQMLLNKQSSSFLYWIGACLVFLAFLLVNHDVKHRRTASQEDQRRSFSDLG